MDREQRDDLLVEQVRQLTVLGGELRALRIAEEAQLEPTLPRLPPRPRLPEGICGWDHEVPAEYVDWDGRVATVRCRCGEVCVVALKVPVACECGRWFLRAGARIMVKRFDCLVGGPAA